MLTALAAVPERPDARPVAGRTPEQIERDRARSRAWHARQRAIVAQSRARVEEPATGNPAGRRPVAQQDVRSPASLSLDERAELVALRSQVVELGAKLAVLEERIEKDRQRSLKNNRRRRQRSGAHQLSLSTTEPARDRSGRHRAGSPPAPTLLTPPGGGGDLDTPEVLTTTTPGVQGGREPAAAADVVWQSVEVLAAAARRPGLDLVLLRAKVDDWRSRHLNVPLRVSL